MSGETVGDFLLQNLTIRKKTKYYCECECPVCGGKLKVCLNPSAYGAYKCWTNQCSAADIRREAGVPRVDSTFGSTFGNSGIFARSLTFEKPPNSLSIPEVEFVPGSLCKLNKYKPLNQVLNITVSPNKRLERKVYQYSPTQRIVRIDDSGSKQIYIQYWNEQWISGTGEEFWELYTYGLESIEIEDTANTIIFVEGEKTCEFVKSCGWACVTAMSGNYKVSALFLNFLLFKRQFPNIKNIVYFPDDDEPGYHKAEITKLAAWKAGLGFYQENIHQFNSANIPGFDLADLPPAILKNYLTSYANERTESIY